MDPLASSHTAHSCAARRLLVMIFALELLLHSSITTVAGASGSGMVEGTGSVCRDSLARLRIRGPHTGPNDLLQRSGSVPPSPDRIFSPAVGMNGVEGSRRILGDISPPGMRPAPDGQDPAPPQERFLPRSLGTGGHGPPPMSPWFVVMHSSQDREDAFLRHGLVADTTYPLVPWTLVIKRLRELGSVLNISSLGFRIRLPGYMRLKNIVGRIVHGHQHVVVPDRDSSSDTVSNAMRPASFGNSDSSQQTNLAEELKRLGRSLLEGGISAHGMRPDSYDAQSQLSESEQETNVAEELRILRRSLLQGDPSPPGMWPDSDDDESELSEFEQGRNLVEDLRIPRRSLLQGDISPPGMWPDSDDDERQLSEYTPERNLVEGLRIPRRRLQGDISPPGMWPDSDDDESQLSESLLRRRRSLLNSFPRRTLLQGDISPAGMWPDSDDDESQLSESILLLRRRLLNM